MSAQGKIKKQQAGGRRDKEIALNKGIAGPGSSSKPSLSSSPPTPPLKPGFTVCTTALEAAYACDVLRAMSYVLVDCEGCDMHALSLVQIGTPHATRIFLFDFLSLLPGDAGARASVVALLADPRVVKIFWDGRSDYWDLLEGCNIRTAPTLDLQLVDIHSRAVRNIDQYAHIVRHVRKSSPPSIVKKWQLEDVHALNGMDGAIREHGLAVSLKDPAVNKMHAENRTDEWLKRPLPTFLLDYAAADIVRIAALYDHFVDRQYIKSDMRPALQAYSDVFYRSCVPLTLEEVATGNVYKRSGILPLNVVPPGYGYGPRIKYRAPAKPDLLGNIVCEMCTRGQPLYCFPYVLTQAQNATLVRAGRLVGSVSGAPRSSSCKTCMVHLQREEFEREEKERKEGNKEAKKLAEQDDARQPSYDVVDDRD